VTNSQNGWPVLESGSSRLRRFTIPANNGKIQLTLRDGSAGFLLCHYLLWQSEEIEDLTGAHPADDWGWAPPRDIVGSDFITNHASGTAADGNATEHPLGVEGTFTHAEYDKIARRIALYEGCLRHGALYKGREDGMHVEINSTLEHCEKIAKKLMDSPRGKRILAANFGLKRVILS
jgi:hypothetical protein